MPEIDYEARPALTEARAELRLLVTLLAPAKEIKLNEQDVFGLVLALQRIAERMDDALDAGELEVHP